MNDETLRQSMTALCNVDEDIANAYKEIGLPPLRTRPPGFETFLSTIISQQLSIKVAAAIQQRVELLLGDVTAQNLLAVSDQQLREAGLSWRKVEYAKGLAEAVVSGTFNIEELEQLSDEEAIASIIQLKGFGRWSAEIYLLFSLSRQNIFPADDLGLLIALGELKGLEAKPTAKQARELIKHWSPWQSAGALFLWQYYHRDK
ncbi:DNA-3-methyladenine glycosylase [Vibrio sp. 99-8-1]|uniref:DNA-3-methyladenine glycosylase family protein n=1 Tax=Vibrio sp. 99-8-1 TaxID=2607602 RepID=UPI0014939529|nr:DNA-3-methyladenine glycosylase [Vibrio sp. 99-8-1]NOI65105.1 DNA-3-methyladenine glycosylase 2 family protein [Vibrio sp. 99-8-1]